MMRLRPRHKLLMAALIFPALAHAGSVYDAMRQASACPAKRAVLTQEQARLDQSRAELAGLESELVQLRRRQDDVQRRRDDLRRDLGGLEQRTSGDAMAYQNQCAQSESCADYEARTGELGRDAAPVNQQLGAVGSEITGTRNQVTNWQGQAGGLQAEYAQRHCNNLVPGQTSQADIDRCSQIFSEWNRVQIAINEQNNRLPQLRSQYDLLAAQAMNLSRRAQDLQTTMAQRCSTSPRLQELRGYQTAQQGSLSYAQDIDRLLADVARLRGTRIGP